MMDNIAYQPGRGNWIIHEDGDAAGLRGGIRTTTTSGPAWRMAPMWIPCRDGCIRIATLNDLNAESTGGFFDAEGKTVLLQRAAQRDRSRHHPGAYRLALSPTVKDICCSGIPVVRARGRAGAPGFLCRQ